MDGRFGNASGLRGKDKELPADGPARVVKPGDWGAVPDAAMKGFPMTAFNMPGRAQPKPTESELKIMEVTRTARKADEAHKQAMLKAQRDAEAAAQAALERGREEGLRDGEGRAWERYRQALEELRGNADRALDTLSGEKASLFLEFEGQVLELFSATVHRVFEGVAKEHADAVLPLLRKAIAALGKATAVTLKVNPADFETVQENQGFWLPFDAETRDFRVVADDRIPQGGCFVESDSTSVGVQADQLAESIDEELKRIFSAKARTVKARMADPGPVEASGILAGAEADPLAGGNTPAGETPEGEIPDGDPKP